MDYVSFASDYMEGCHPAILELMRATNRDQHAGYGTDKICASARAHIQEACACPNAAVHFLAGGTQTNACVLDALLAPWEGVLAATTGHIATHEAGAIERSGHKVIELAGERGKLPADRVREAAAAWETDANHDHMVRPGVVYISQPTEYGTLYTLEELEGLRAVCDEYDMRLYVDGARLAYALACDVNDVTLSDLARLADAFYIGGTKCGALLGEAVVFPNPSTCPQFFTLTKQHGALLAKGWLLGMQFEALFCDDLYLRVGRPAIEAANAMRRAFEERGYRLMFDSPTNQVFVELDDATARSLAEHVGYSFWEKTDRGHTIVRFATSWATTQEDVATLGRLL
ncbi:MAG: beta-eliminating lyase-related protein [Coriobacteriales bacterium]|nr:beta-eliminating lyase-related protein [Coriobacteriales bacterium]